MTRALGAANVARVGRLKAWLGRALLLCGGVLFALLLAEAYLRLVDPLGQRLRGDTILLPTNTRVVVTQVDNPKLEREIVLTHNSLGFRGPDPPSDFDERLTLLAIGGSTTECRSLTDGKDWPAVLGRELSRSFERLWIDNAGLDGHSSFGHLKLVEQRVVRLRPKLALFLTGINDVARDGLKYQDAALTDRPDLERESRFFLFAARHSALASLALNARRARQARALSLQQPHFDLGSLPHDTSGRRGRAVARAHAIEFAPRYRERMLALVRACRTASIEPVLMTQPALYGPAIDDLTGIDLGTIEVDPQDGTNGAMAWARLEAYNEVLRELGSSEAVVVVDVGRALPKSSRLFYDFVHFTNEGAAEVARLAAHDLCPALATRFPQYATARCAHEAP